MAVNHSSPTLRHMAQDTIVLSSDRAGFDQAVQFLRGGALVGMPTETVYGLAGDARNPAAVAAIFAAKGRPTFNPLIAHVADMAMAESVAVFNDLARKLAARFWPGPLTMVLPLQEGHGLAELALAGNPTVALRMPAHPAAQTLLKSFGGPLAGPSANPSGRISPTRVDHVLDGLGGKIAAVLDGGPCRVGVESTIIGFPLVDGAIRASMLRQGGIAQEEIEEITGPLLSGGHAEKPNAPGQLTSHYAPEALVRLGVTTPESDEIWVGFGPNCQDSQLSLSPNGDLVEAAATLFQILRQADALASEGQRIAFAPVPNEGLGRAINDRLSRAAAPRS